MLRSIFIALALLAAPALAQELKVQDASPRFNMALVSSAQAALLADGTFELYGGATPEKAAADFPIGFDSREFCDSVVYLGNSGIANAGGISAVMMLLRSNLPDGTWHISLMPDGEVKYDNYRPTPEADAFFKALATRLKCH